MLAKRTVDLLLVLMFVLGAFTYSILFVPETKVDTEDLTKTIYGQQQKIKHLQQQLKHLKMTSQNNTLEPKVVSYIKQKYQHVPKVVAEEIAKQVVRISKNENIPPQLLLAIIQVESSFNPMSISSKNARGLMQVMPVWARKFNLKKVNDLHDISTNIDVGTKVLKIHIQEKNGNLNKGLEAYSNHMAGYLTKIYNAVGQFAMFCSFEN